MEPQEATDEKRWATAQRKFDALCRRLESNEARGMTHSAAESALKVDGDEILRLLLQEYLALRAERETPPSTALVGRDGVARTHLRRHSRPLETIFGTVEVTRIGHGQRGVASLHPLDAELNLPVERYSFGVRRRVAEAAAMGSFDAAVATLSAATAASVPKRQAEELARRAAHDFEAFYEAKAEIADKPGALVVMSLDGKGVVMRVQDLKAATRKKAQATKHKRLKRLTPARSAIPSASRPSLRSTPSTSTRARPARWRCRAPASGSPRRGRSANVSGRAWSGPSSRSWSRCSRRRSDRTRQARRPGSA